jgi:hypothetical protein
MSKNIQLPTKRLKIDKANTVLVASIAVSAAVIVFTLVASKTLVSQYNYQNRVIGAKRAADTQLKTDVTAATSLINSYKNFVNTPTNVLGGSSTGSNTNDGNNAQIILDALPDKYDFPGLLSTFYNLLKSTGVTIATVSGSDEEISAEDTQSSSTATPQVMPIAFSVTGSYSQITTLINTLQSSIRPINIQKLQLAAATQNELSVTVNVNTYYQPDISFSIGTEAVK